jgi:hypothetical protein
VSISDNPKYFLLSSPRAVGFNSSSERILSQWSPAMRGPRCPNFVTLDNMLAKSKGKKILDMLVRFFLKRREPLVS